MPGQLSPYEQVLKNTAALLSKSNLIMRRIIESEICFTNVWSGVRLSLKGASYQKAAFFRGKPDGTHNGTTWEPAEISLSKFFG